MAYSLPETCEKKKRYLSEKAARQHRNQFRKSPHYTGGVVPYKCEHCRSWHLGRKPKRLPWGKLREMRKRKAAE